MKKTVGLVVVMLAVILVTGCSRPLIPIKGSSSELNKDEIKTKLETFINENLMQPGSEAKVTEVTLENGLYKTVLDVGTGQPLDAYMTKDGKMFFPDAINLEETIEKIKAMKKQQEEAAAKTSAEAPKSAVPVVELFAMSYCPYGTQAEKGILPVVNLLKNKINFSLKFVSYAMHGEKELNENLRQYCIQKQAPAKLSSYLNCFLKKGEGTEVACMAAAGVSSQTVNACMNETDAQFKVKEKFNDKSSWKNGQFPPFDVQKADNEKYGVGGSPVLIINGTEISTSSRDSASYLKAICSAFTTEPKECQTKLSTTAPAAGFSESSVQGATTSSGSCGE